MTIRVLVVNDSATARAALRAAMMDEPDIDVVGELRSGSNAVSSVESLAPDVVLMDIVMPEVDGLEVCRQLGGEGGIPIVILTGRATENDLLLGLYLGADDYLTKPFSPRELVARIRTVLRRTRRARDLGGNVIEIGRLRIDVDRHEVRVDGNLAECTPVEFEILQALALRPGRVLSRRQLLEHVHGGADFLTERTVDSHVMNLRRKIETDASTPRLLLTVYGVGYKLADDTSTDPASDEPS